MTAITLSRSEPINLKPTRAAACHANSCASNPCQNGGSCNSGVTNYGYTCQCTLGWTGKNCETPPCAGTPAWNSALAQTVDSCSSSVGYIELYFAGGAYVGASSAAPSETFCYASDPNWPEVLFDYISPAEADACIALLTPLCP